MEADFAVIDRIRDCIPVYPEDEVEADSRAAVEEVRSKMRAEQQRTGDSDPPEDRTMIT